MRNCFNKHGVFSLQASGGYFMSSEWIALLILVVTIILYFIEIIPIYLTAIMSALAMVIAGIIPFEDAFVGLSSNTILLIIGMSIISKSLSDNGITGYISKGLLKLSKLSEKLFILAAFLFAAMSASILSSLVALTMFLPVIDEVVKHSDERFSYKHLYMTTAIGSVLGGIVTSVGTSSMMNASAILVNSGYGRGMHFFEPSRIGLPVLICVIIVYLTVGYKLQKKAFNFKDHSLSVQTQELNKNTKFSKKLISSLTSVFCIICFVLEVMPLGLTAMIGAVILILTKCVDEKTVFKSINWSTIFVIVGSLGFASGLDKSGATTYLVDFFVDFFHFSKVHAFVPCVFALLMSTILSNFMSNNSAVAVMAPMAIQIAETFGVDAMAFVMACAIGANISLATPICTANITMTTSCGYRFKDYVIVGGLYNSVAFFVAATMLYVVYFI